jgi:hypothetical protein
MIGQNIQGNDYIRETKTSVSLLIANCRLQTIWFWLLQVMKYKQMKIINMEPSNAFNHR